ncbi:hypothetical protein MAPG_09766 [Magnaporthiopsis poae ATCC 64411]|uniref:Uncharacterized protein n=1 Tax=Magnaporthiopsis poae (strain ATCC 64411 / 73-15) TaxID=644358 RepID=A0A0C4EAT6_MAGP6|nr:hypothetical protein MAPG_09766 [Magnaporthiopsis poae ATCC 64411]
MATDHLTARLLTLIITTSPTPSAPSTELLSQVLESFRCFCPDLLTCRVIVVLDTFDHIAPRARLKRGQVTKQGAEVYDLYKQKVKELFLSEHGRRRRAPAHAHGGVAADVRGAPDPTVTGGQGAPEGAARPMADLVESQGEAEFGYEGRNNPLNSAVQLAISRTTDGMVTFVEPADRLGFGLAVRTGLRLAGTKYVWVHQHDWTLVTEIPIASMLDVMMASGHSPADDVSRPPGSPEEAAAGTNEASCGPPIKYICLPSGRLLSYAVQAHVTRYPALLRTTGQLKRSFVPSGSTTPTSSDSESPPPVSPSIPLTPLFFWHDKPHIAETAHYLARVFPTRLAMGRGDFIEDTIGHRARDQMKEGAWAKWACWLYYPDDGKRLCLRHLQGRHWLGAAAEQERKETWIALNIKGGRKMALKKKKKQPSGVDKEETGTETEPAGMDQLTMSLAEAL